MDHLINKVFSIADRERIIELVDGAFPNHFTGSDEAIRSAKLLLGKLVLVDRKGLKSLPYFESVGLSGLFEKTDAEDFLYTYTETFNIDDIVRSELGAEFMDDATDLYFEVTDGVRDYIVAIKEHLKGKNINLYKQKNYLTACGEYLNYLQEWADLVRTAVVYSLHSYRIKELSESLTVDQLNKFVRELPNGVLDYVGLSFDDTLAYFLRSLEQYTQDLQSH